MQQQYYMGGDVSKGYADFVILDSKKQPIEEYFQIAASADHLVHFKYRQQD